MKKKTKWGMAALAALILLGFLIIPLDVVRTADRQWMIAWWTRSSGFGQSLVSDAIYELRYWWSGSILYQDFHGRPANSMAELAAGSGKTMAHVLHETRPSGFSPIELERKGDGWRLSTQGTDASTKGYRAWVDEKRNVHLEMPDGRISSAGYSGSLSRRWSLEEILNGHRDLFGRHTADSEWKTFGQRHPDYEASPAQSPGPGEMSVTDRGRPAEPPLSVSLQPRQQVASEDFDLPFRRTLKLGQGLTIELVLIAPGVFEMGTPSEKKRRSDETHHKVRITEPFYLGVTEVTKPQYEAVTGTTPWEGNHYAGRFPHAAASDISWEQAQEFCRALGEQVGRTVRLPTEAEWEYACRAGSTTVYHFGNDPAQLGNYAWYKDNAADEGRFYAHAVAQKKPNQWALYDMHGNVFEWCSDWYGSDYYKHSPVEDPHGPLDGTYRVIRGGSWIFEARYCASAKRDRHHPAYGHGTGGLRIVMPVR